MWAGVVFAIMSIRSRAAYKSLLLIFSVVSFSAFRMRSNFGKAASTRLSEYSAPSSANHTVEPSERTLTMSSSPHEESVFPNSFNACAGMSISSSFETSQGDFARDNLFPSVATAMNMPSAVLRKHVPRYFGKS